MQVDASQTHVGQRPDAGDGLRQTFSFKAETAETLVFGQGDIDTQAHAEAAVGGQLREPVQFPPAVQVDGHAIPDRLEETVLFFDGTVVDDALETQGAGEPEFGIRNDFGRGTCLAQDAQDLRVRIGFDRVSHLRITEMRCERFGEVPVVGPQLVGIEEKTGSAESFIVHRSSL